MMPRRLPPGDGVEQPGSDGRKQQAGERARAAPESAGVFGAFILHGFYAPRAADF